MIYNCFTSRKELCFFSDIFYFSFLQVMIEIPYLFVLSVVYGVIVYAMIGFEWTAAKFFWYLFFMFFTLLYFTFYGMLTVAITPNHHIAAIVSTLFYGLWNVFSGFVIPRPVSIFLPPFLFKMLDRFHSFPKLCSRFHSFPKLCSYLFSCLSTCQTTEDS